MWIVVVKRKSGMLSLYGRYSERESADYVQSKVSGDVMSFDEYLERYF